MSVSSFEVYLPSPLLNSLHADLPRRINAIENDHDFGAFINLTETILELDTIFRPPTLSQPARAPRAPQPPLSSALVVPPSPLAVPDARPAKKGVSLQQLQILWLTWRWSYQRDMFPTWWRHGGLS